MTEKQVKDALKFLCVKYKMNYTFAEFENYMGTNANIETYNYYNKYGCFTIANVAVRGDVDYYHLDSIDQLKDILFSRPPNLGVLTSKNEKQYKEYANNILKYKLRIYDFEPEIWQKHRKSGFLKIPFFWGSEKQILQALADVIEAQIEKNCSFFGIKV